MVSGRPLRAGTGAGYDGRVRAGGTVVPVVPIKLYPKKVTKLTKKVTKKFSELVTFLSKLVTFFWVQMMGTTGTTRGGTSVPYPESVPTVPNSTDRTRWSTPPSVPVLAYPPVHYS